MIHGIDPRTREQAYNLRKARTNHRIGLVVKTIMAVATVGIILAVIM